MEKRNILVVCTTCRDRRELEKKHFKQNYNIFFQDYDDSIIDKIACGVIKDFPSHLAPEKQYEELLAFCKKNNISGVVSTDDYPGSLYASIISHHLNLPGPSPKSVITCHHKYYSRIAQTKSVPNAAPDFWLIEKDTNAENFAMPFPVFVKPVKSFFSIFANKISNPMEFETAILSSFPREEFLYPLNWFLKHYTSYERSANYLIAESMLEGSQVTLEGYVYKGEVNILGVVDSIMYPGTQSFQRFQYPSQLSLSVQERMHEIAEKFIKSISFDNSLFNIELMYNPTEDTIHIIEVNPRMCNQFSDLFEKVDGINTYEILIDSAVGKKPRVIRRSGAFKIAASCVWRRFDNGLVARTPKPEELEKLYKIFPEARVEIHVKEGEYLDEILQDGKSYRYAIVHLGADNIEELFSKNEYCKQLLKFQFS